jgi:hypothetical protein
MTQYGLLFRRIVAAVKRRGPVHLLKLVPYIGDFLYDVAADVAEQSRKDHEGEKFADVIRAMLQAHREEIRAEAELAVEDVAPNQPQKIHQALTDFLIQMPDCARRSLRSSNGVTIPSRLQLRSAHDLLPFLPNRLPQFRAGDRPLKGVDRELISLLGIGGFGEVWKARNPFQKNDAPVALKFCTNSQTVPFLRNEAVLLDRVKRAGSQPGIVKLLQTYLSAEIPCLEYEFIEGGDFAGLIRSWHNSGQKPSAIKASQVILELAEIVGVAHRMGIVHRDLKPANILVQQCNNRIHLKVTDFGIGDLTARLALDAVRKSGNSSRSTGKGDIPQALRGAHTPLYASPQQLHGKPPSPHDDVYALGVIWYQVLTGQLDTGAPTGRQWKQDVPEPLAELLESCVEQDENARPADANVLAADLKKYLERNKSESQVARLNKCTTTQSDSTPAPSIEYAALVKAIAIAGGILALLVILIIIIPLFRGRIFSNSFISN